MAPSKRNPKAKARHSYSADRAITSKKEDLLGRSNFASSLADDIRAWGGRDSLVIALYGGWGSGKTSLKNLILSNLEGGRHPIPVMEFNPWQFSGTGGIAPAFFRELGIALRCADNGRNGKERGAKLERYAKCLSVGSATTGALGSLLSIVGVPGGGLVSMAGEQVKKMADLTQAGSDALSGEASKKGVSELKKELSDSLASSKTSLLVVIDDIDRLSTNEVREVLQLVKANADFPNLIYLLLCERSIVAGALDGITGGRGGEFLEKIIQVGFDLPHVSRESLREVLVKGFARCLDIPGIDNRWDAMRWAQLFQNGFFPYFQNLRHVYRFLASFDFHVRQFRKGDRFEVNPLDLIALETLRVFDPAIYERLPAAKNALTREEGRSTSGELKQEAVEAILTQLLSYVPGERRERVKTTLGLVFPAVASGYSHYSAAGNGKTEWLRQARVCHRDLFDKYFTLVIADNDLSQAELDRLVELFADRAKFITECEALQSRGLLKIAFTRLDAFREQISLDVLPSLLRALCDLSDTILTSEKEFNFNSGFDLATIAWRLAYFGLRGEKDEKKRFEVLRDAFNDSGGILLPAEIVSMDARNAERNGAGLDYLLSEEDRLQLQAICLEKISKAAEDGTLQNHAQADTLLWHWRNWAPDEMRKWATSECANPAMAVWFLSKMMGRASSGADVRYNIRLSEVEGYIAIETLESCLAQVDENTLDDIERSAMQEFRRAVRRKKEGKPEQSAMDRFREEN